MQAVKGNRPPSSLSMFRFVFRYFCVISQCIRAYGDANTLQSVLLLKAFKEFASGACIKRNGARSV